MKRLILFLLLLQPWLGSAQLQVSGRAQAGEESLFIARADKYRIGRDEDLTVTFTLYSSGSNFQMPALEDFVVLSGPNKSFATSIVNNRISRELSYSVVLRPRRLGTLTVGSARIKTESGWLETKPLEVEVVAVSPRASDPNDPHSLAAENAFIRAEWSRTSAYLGEPVRLDLVLYYTPHVNVSYPQLQEQPEFTGFYQRNIEFKNDFPRGERVVNGTAFRTVTLSQTVLIPQKSGKISLKPLMYQLPTEIPTNRRDIFGRRYSERVNQLITVDIPALTVKELPEGRTHAFTGAVGSYRLKASLSRNSIEANQSVTLKLTLEGEGNLPLVDLPEVELPSDLEQYDPSVSDQINLSPSGFSGRKTSETVIVPRYAGTYKIPVPALEYFDPSRRVYATAEAGELSLEVTGGAPRPAGTAAAPIGGGGSAVNYLDGDNIRYIQTEPLWIAPSVSGSRNYWYYFLGGLLAYGLVWLGSLIRSRLTGKRPDRRIQAVREVFRDLQAAEKGGADEILRSLESAFRKLALAYRRKNEQDLGTLTEVWKQEGLTESACREWEELVREMEEGRYMPRAQADAARLLERGKLWIKTNLSA